METWVTGDHHFGHTNVLKYCNRHFSDIVTHDETLIDEWNKVVSRDDIVYHLGDFTLSNIYQAEDVAKKLNGTIRILVNYWHHDKRWLEFGDGLKNMILNSSIVVLEPGNYIGNSMPIILCHYPFEVWDRKHYGAIHFHGHSHGNLHRIHNRLDVGVDMAYKLLGNYRPFSFHEAISLANGYYDEGYKEETGDA